MSTPLERIKNKVHIINESYANENISIEELVEDIKRLILCKKLVPVICEDMFEYINPNTGEKQSLQSFIVEQIVTKHPLNVLYTDSEVQEMLYQGYSGMSILYRKYGRKFYDYVNKSVLDENNKIRKGITLKKEVTDFLKKGKFPLIITTSCFKIVEEILGGYSTCVYEPNFMNDESIVGNCVYHIMGESRPNRPECGIEERQVLKYLSSLYSSDYAPKNLTTYLNNNQDRRTLFFLGNNTPNWLFRFLLSPMYPVDLYEEGHGFYLNNKKTRDEHLERFLEDIRFEKEDEMVSVLEKVTSKLPSLQNDRIGHNKKWDFFLSHASEDNAYALQLKNILETNGLNVWYDDSEIKDGAYWQRIIDGIENSAIFLPLLSVSYFKKVTPKKKRIQVFQKHGIETLSHDPRKCLLINKDEDIPVSGVQLELLLAESQYSNQDVPSIPVILSDEVIESFDLDIEITAEYIENTAKDSRCLPEKLFRGIQMYLFDKNNPSSFELNWDRYKGNTKSKYYGKE